MTVPAPTTKCSGPGFSASSVSRLPSGFKAANGGAQADNGRDGFPAWRSVIDNDPERFGVSTTRAAGYKRGKRNYRLREIQGVRDRTCRRCPVTGAASVSGLPIRVRRLAALDLAGPTGALGRRGRLVRLEFVASATLGIALGAWFLAAGAPAWLAVWSLGIGVNYLALSAHGIELLRHPDHLYAELDGVDVRQELRRYSVSQLLLVMPFLVALAAAVQHAGNAFAARSTDGRS